MQFKKYLALSAIALTLVGCSRVPQGHVGIRVHTLGSDKGPDEEVLTMGRYWIAPTQELHLFPIFTQNYVWTLNEEKNSPTDESITFQDNQGLPINTDIGIEMYIDPDSVLGLFQKYRLGVYEIIHGPLRNAVRDSFVIHGSEMSIEEIYGSGKGKLISLVQKDIDAIYSGLGINVTKIYWVGEMRIPQSVKDGITEKVRSTQLALQRENELRQTEAEAAKAIAEAQGLAQVRLERARAEAESIRLLGEALRSNPMVLQQQSIEKWDGVLPKIVGGNEPVPFIDVTETTK